MLPGVDCEEAASNRKQLGGILKPKTGDQTLMSNIGHTGVYPDFFLCRLFPTPSPRWDFKRVTPFVCLVAPVLRRIITLTNCKLLLVITG